MRNLIFIITILNQQLFFIGFSILGKNYGGINEDMSYVLFCGITAALSILFIIYNIFILRHITYNFNSVIFFLLPFFVSMIFVLENPYSELAKRYFIFYLLWSLTSTYIGVVVADLKSIPSMAKWFEVIMIFLTIGVIVSFIIPFLRNTVLLSYAVNAYQAGSYISAFAYSLNLFFILFGYRYNLFSFHNYKIYKIAIYTFLPLQILAVLISGGRGGFILISISTIALLFLKQRDNQFGFMKPIIIIIILLLGIIYSLPSLMHEEMFKSGFERVFSYITPHGIDFSQTSNRDVVYDNAIRLIGQKPLRGYGLFGYLDKMDYPHNVILEILLNGGILYLLFAIIIGLFFLRKLRVIIKLDPSNLLVLILFLFPLVMLMFSGTYITTSLFWFVLSYVFCYDKRTSILPKS